MKPQYHILNGDALKDQFPKDIIGNTIVARECLVDGNVKGTDLTEFYLNRAKFLNDNYGNCSEEDYFRKTISEFRRVELIPKKAEVNLWFEDDLFCQVNCWFILWLLHQSGRDISIFLIRPQKISQYGFGGLIQSDLLSIYADKILLSQSEELAKLWTFYQNDETEKLLIAALKWADKYPFILRAVEAHIERIPTGGNLGRPKESIIQIMKDLDTKEFGPVFREFSKREYIYGFGDLQVKRLVDEVLQNM